MFIPEKPPSYEEAMRTPLQPTAPPPPYSENEALSIPTQPPTQTPPIIGNRPEVTNNAPILRRHPSGNQTNIALMSLGEVESEGKIEDCFFDTKTNKETGDPEYVYVKMEDSMHKYDVEGQQIREWRLPSGPACMDTERDLIVSGSGSHISRATRLGDDPQCIYGGSVHVNKNKARVTSMAYHDQSDRYVLVDSYRNDVLFTDATSGKVKAHVTKSNSYKSAALIRPVSVSCHQRSPHGLIAVTESANHCVKLYNIKAKLIRTLGSHGDGRCQLNSPRGVCMDAMGRIVVCDHGNKRVVRFTRMCVGGSWRWECILSPEMLAHRHPSHVDISDDGHMVVTLTTADDQNQSWALFKGYR